MNWFKREILRDEADNWLVPVLAVMAIVAIVGVLA